MSKVLKFATKIATSNFKELPLPYKLTYILTYRCQYKCNICNIWKKTPAELSSELATEQIERFFRQSNHFSWINLSGGEIFLRPDLISILSIIAKNCEQLCALNFPTNGAQTELITDTVKKLLEIKNIPRIFITISLNGPPRIHDRICGVEGAWQNAMATYRQLTNITNRKLHVLWGTTLQPDNVKALPAMREAAKKEIHWINDNDFHVNLVHYSSHYYDNINQKKEKNTPDNNRQLGTALASVIQSRRHNPLLPVNFLEQRYQKLAKAYLFEQQTPLPCQSLGASVFMNPAGDIYPCSVYNQCLGNIADYNFDLRKLWSSPVRQNLRSDIRRGKCPQCWSPCEAYPSILANLLRMRREKK